MSYVIACDSRNVEAEVLFMVDRKKTQKSFWSNRLTDVRTFPEKMTAESAVKKLRFNNPRVLTFKEARALEEKNGELSGEFPEGWDEHKEWI